MPAVRLSGIQSAMVATFDIVAKDGPSSRSNFLTHVGLYRGDPRRVSNAQGVNIVHMIPPLRTGAMEVHALGGAEFDEDDLHLMRQFVDSTDLEIAKQEKLKKPLKPLEVYTIRPHYIKASPEKPYRRFSCSGFVFEAYKFIGIVLVDLKKLPDVDLETLVRAYPEQERRLRRKKLRELFNLSGDGPWAVLLPGHIINSLNRPREEIMSKSYQAKPGDEYFPPRRVAESSREN